MCVCVLVWLFFFILFFFNWHKYKNVFFVDFFLLATFFFFEFHNARGVLDEYVEPGDHTYVCLYACLSRAVCVCIRVYFFHK